MSGRSCQQQYSLGPRPACRVPSSPPRSEKLMISGRCSRYLDHPSFAGGDRGFALEEKAGALDDRHVDHLAIDGDGADTLGQRLVVGSREAAGVVDFLRAGTEFLVEDRDLARMDNRGADKANAARAPDRLPEAVEVVKLGDGGEKPQWHDAGGACGG